MIFYPTFENHDRKESSSIWIGFLEGSVPRPTDRVSLRVIVHLKGQEYTMAQVHVWRPEGWVFVVGLPYDKLSYPAALRDHHRMSHGSADRKSIAFREIRGQWQELQDADCQRLLALAIDILYPALVDGDRVNGIGASRAFLINHPEQEPERFGHAQLTGQELYDHDHGFPLEVPPSAENY